MPKRATRGAMMPLTVLALAAAWLRLIACTVLRVRQVEHVDAPG